jgi:hypothetical protein
LHGVQDPFDEHASRKYPRCVRKESQVAYVALDACRHTWVLNLKI